MLKLFVARISRLSFSILRLRSVVAKIISLLLAKKVMMSSLAMLESPTEIANSELRLPPFSSTSLFWSNKIATLTRSSKYSFRLTSRLDKT